MLKPRRWDNGSGAVGTSGGSKMTLSLDPAATVNLKRMRITGRDCRNDVDRVAPDALEHREAKRQRECRVRRMQQVKRPRPDAGVGTGATEEPVPQGACFRASLQRGIVEVVSVPARKVIPNDRAGCGPCPSVLLASSSAPRAVSHNHGRRS